MKYVCWGLSRFGSIGIVSPRQGKDPCLIPEPWTFFALLLTNYSEFSEVDMVVGKYFLAALMSVVAISIYICICILIYFH